MEILHIYISPDHSFAGRFGMEPADHPMVEVPQIECVSGRDPKTLPGARAVLITLYAFQD